MVFAPGAATITGVWFLLVLLVGGVRPSAAQAAEPAAPATPPDPFEPGSPPSGDFFLSPRGSSPGSTTTTPRAQPPSDELSTPPPPPGGTPPPSSPSSSAAAASAESSSSTSQAKDTGDITLTEEADAEETDKSLVVADVSGGGGFWEAAATALGIDIEAGPGTNPTCVPGLQGPGESLAPPYTPSLNESI